MEMLPNPQSSGAVLIGVANYGALEPLPAVENDLVGVRAALTDSRIWGLPGANCRVVPEPRNADAVLDILQTVSNLTSDTLVVYFAGHGLPDVGNDDELYLALPGSNIERVYRTALPYSWVRRELRDAKARRKVVILDCCYSGRALGRMGDGSEQIADLLEIEGTCVLTATARTRKALARPGERFTAFTGELLAILQNGIQDGPDLLDMDTLFRHLTLRLRSKGLPSPQRGALNRGGDIVIARNLQFKPPEVARPEREAVSAAVSIPPQYSAPEPQPAVDADESGTGGGLVTAITSPVESGPEPIPVTGVWRQELDPDRPPTLRPWVDRPTRLARQLSGTPTLLGCWLVYVLWLAATRRPSEWLWAGAAVGTAAVISSVLPRVSSHGWLSTVQTTSNALLIASCLALYAVSAFTEYIGTALSHSHIIEISLIAGAALPIVIILALARQHSRHLSRYLRDRSARNCAEAARHTCWLTEATVDNADVRLLDPLYSIPAARFAATQGTFTGFLVVAGARILLVVSTLSTSILDSWFDFIIRDVIDLRTLLAEFRPKIIVILESADRKDEPFQIAYGKEDINFVPRNEFADVAGPFLLSEAYELDGYALESVYSALETTSKQVATIGGPHPRRGRSRTPAPGRHAQGGLGDS
jgi:hypothetical protein